MSFYNKLLNEMDNGKRFFSQQDIKEIDKYEFLIDDEINSGSLEFGLGPLSESAKAGSDSAPNSRQLRPSALKF